MFIGLSWNFAITVIAIYFSYREAATLSSIIFIAIFICATAGAIFTVKEFDP
jgi:hypothetical protein